VAYDEDMTSVFPLLAFVVVTAPATALYMGVLHDS
jgi:hypothetical protein